MIAQGCPCTDTHVHTVPAHQGWPRSNRERDLQKEWNSDSWRNTDTEKGKSGKLEVVDGEQLRWKETEMKVNRWETEQRKEKAHQPGGERAENKEIRQEETWKWWETRTQNTRALACRESIGSNKIWKWNKSTDPRWGHRVKFPCISMLEGVWNLLKCESKKLEI